ncbi:MAG: hypothetical protein IJ217_01545 [Clostridia bacterium]|nr:hypothetical protein [Clostridia bacterium]
MDFFDFSKSVKREDLISRLKYYHEKADEGMKLLHNNKNDALSIQKNLKEELAKEYKEYSKVKLQEHILKNGDYSQYVSNITDAYVNQKRGKSVEVLRSNLYDIFDYMCYGFEEEFINK